MESLTHTWAGYLGLIAFVAAYTLVIVEEKIELKKSKPVLFSGCLMWMGIGIYESMHGHPHAHEFVEHLIAEIGGLFFFLLVAMTFINTLEERNVFRALRGWLLNRGFGFRKLFWATGLIAFFLSPVADNMTTALLMSSVALAVSDGNPRFIVPTFVSIVVAANAGGAWSPFGDITTLMVWVDKKVQTQDFVHLMIPSVINWLVPALIMVPFVPKGHPASSKERIHLKPGARGIILLGILTIATAVSFHQFLDLPPFLGMMMASPFNVVQAPQEIPIGPPTEYHGTYLGLLQTNRAILYVSESILMVNLFFGGATNWVELIVKSFCVFFWPVFVGLVFPRFRIDQSIPWFLKIPLILSIIGIFMV